MGREIEDDFEKRVLNWLREVGWESYYTTEGGEYGSTQLDTKYGRAESDIVYEEILKQQLPQLNTRVTEDNVETVTDAIKSKLRSQKSLLRTNREFYSVLHRGIDVELNTPTGKENVTVTVVDTETPENNRFDAVSQFQYAEQRLARPDVVLFVNGIPLIVMELKNTARQKSYEHAIEDLQAYEQENTSLFYPVLFNVALTQSHLRYGAPTASETHYNPWKPEDLDEDIEYGNSGYEVELSLKSLCDPHRIIDILNDFVFYDMASGVKAVPRHQQYFATKQIEERTDYARDTGQRGKGLVWHTQGSGKSFTMYYAARKYSSTAKCLIVVDRADLRKQFKNELQAIEPGFHNAVVAQSRKTLVDELQTTKNQIVLTTIQLFEDIQEENIVPDEMEVFVFADEAHREMEKIQGTRLKAAIPQAHHYGFTGTPVDLGSERNTFKEYSMEKDIIENEPYLHRYSMKTACNEGVITRVDVTSRAGVLEWEISDKLEEQAYQKFGDVPKEKIRERVSELLTETEMAELDTRIRAIAEDIAEHHEKRIAENGLKSMVIAPTRLGAARYAKYLKEQLGDDSVDVLYTRAEKDSGLLENLHNSSGARSDIVKSFKRTDEPEVLVVCDMLLTGFDAPILGRIYMDRKLVDHNLLQAIARANRPKEGKKCGRIIDYRGVINDIRDMYESRNEQRDIDAYLSSNMDEFIDEYEATLKSLEDECGITVETTDEPPSKIGDKMFDKGLETARNYLELFTDARDLRDAIMPDERIVAFEEQYMYLEGVYGTINHHFELRNGGDEGGNDIDKEGMIEVIEENVTARRREHVFEKEQSIDDVEPTNLNVVERSFRLEDVLQSRVSRSPAEADLLERVEEIIRRWDQDIVSNEKAYEELSEVEKELSDRPSPNASSEFEWMKYVVRGVIDVKLDADIDDEQIYDDIVRAVEEKWDEIEKMPRDKQLKRLTTAINKSLLKNAEARLHLLESQKTRTIADTLLRNLS